MARPSGDVDPLTPAGYRAWARCPRGARFERWVTAADAKADLLPSALLAFENQSLQPIAIHEADDPGTRVRLVEAIG